MMNNNLRLHAELTFKYFETLAGERPLDVCSAAVLVGHELSSSSGSAGTEVRGSRDFFFVWAGAARNGIYLEASFGFFSKPGRDRRRAIM
jgi:hypothetical protein